MSGIKGIEFIYLFVSAFIGLLFAEPINTLATNVANNSTGMASVLYSYIGVFYALCLIGLMIGALAGFFKARK